MFGQAIAPIRNWNLDYQTIGYGNYGYGIYSQDSALGQNPFTGGLNIERDIDFVPLGRNAIGSYGSFPAAYHQHYIY